LYQNGTISARVYTSVAQIPVAGATVAISQRQTGKKHTLLAVRITDENGEIPPVEVPAPPAQESKTPGTVNPFTAVDLRVEHPGYQQEVVEDAQVFSGVNSLQEVELIPMAEHEIPRNSYNIVQITPQPLT